MMPEINDALLAISNSLAASVLAKATVIAALGLIGAWLSRRSRAAVRHALLAVSLGAIVVLPVTSIVAPPIRIAVQVAAPRIVTPPFPGTVSSRIEPPGTRVGVTPAISQSSNLSLSALLLTGWIAGALLFLLPMAVGLRQVRSLRRSGLPWQSGQSVVDELARDAGIQRHVEALLHESLPGPMTCGVLHPAIMVPLDAQNWEREDLNRAIVHELEHVRRRDWATHCLARAVCAMYWFHPLVWIAWRRLDLEAERSCDDAVLERSEATTYADQLVGVAQRLSQATKSPLLAMANRADLAARVGAVLDSRQRRGRAGVFPVALACAAAAVLLLAVSPLRMVAAPQSANTETQATEMPRFSARAMLVITNVTVSDQGGKNIPGLSASDFAITEDGVAQTISVFGSQAASLINGVQDSVLSYYTLGYYTNNPSVNDQFRKINVTFKGDASAKLNYRVGYYAFARSGQSLAGQGSVNRGIGLDASVPILLRKVSPEYSEEARKAKYQGTVQLDVEVDTSGQVTNVHVVHSLGLGLDEKAIEAVKQWRFRPAMKDGRPVAVQTLVDVDFRLL